MQPPLPLIAVVNHALMLVKDKNSWSKASALSLIKNVEKGAQYYDSKGRRWETKIHCESFNPTLLNRLLATTLYNPIVPVTRAWMQVGAYALEELKQAIANCIDEDDDILTQWVGAESLKAKLIACTTFTDISDLLSAYVFDPDEEKINQEFPDEE